MGAGVSREARERRGGRLVGLAALALGAIAVLLSAAADTLAAPQVNGEFSVSGLGTYNAITQGPDGNMWVTLDAGNDVARITPAGNVQQFNPMDLNNPVGITAFGNSLWVTQSGGVAKFSTGNPNGAVATSVTGLGDAHAIAVGSDGSLWTASGNTVFQVFEDAAGAVMSIPHSGLVNNARGTAAGGDGNIWVADAGGQRIVSLTTAGDEAPGSPYDVGGGPQGIARGPGTQMAFTNPLAGPPHEVGRITPGGSPATTPIGTSDPFGITIGPDGAYWIGRFSTNNLGRLTPNGQFTQLGGFSTNAGPRQLAPGPNNTLWVTLQTADKVARVTGVGPTGGGGAGGGGCTDNEFAFGKVKKNRKKGTAKLPVEVPCAGDLELAKTKKVKADEEVVEAEGEEKLVIKPKGKAKTKLNKKGKARVKAKVTYAPEGGEPNTHSKKVKLKKR